MPAPRIGPLLSSSPGADNLPPSEPVCDENGPRTVKRLPPASDNRPHARSIFQEIQRSGRRPKLSPRSPLGNIFPDAASPSLLAVATFGSVPTPPEPIPSEPDPPMSQLREVSGNAQRKPLLQISPLARAPGKGARKKPVQTVPQIPSSEPRPRPTARNHSPASYIEHLESQLATSRAQLDALTSPVTIRGQAARIRSLERQNAGLLTEIADWTAKFDERVEEEVWRRTRIEAELKNRIRDLEDEVEARQVAQRTTEIELEDARQKLKQIEEVEIALGSRVDTLTELLAQSPTRLEARSGSRCSLPVMPTTPNFKRLSLSREHSVANSASSHRYQQPTTSIQEALENDEEGEQTWELTMPGSPSLVRRESSQSRIEAPISPSISSTAPSRLRPRSYHSASSHSSTAADTLANDESRSCQRRRPMRRFAPGATTLKPLILPATTATPSQSPMSAPARDGTLSPVRDRRPSNASADVSLLFASPVAGELLPLSPSPRAFWQRRKSWMPPKPDADIFVDRPHWEDTPDEMHLSRMEVLNQENGANEKAVTFSSPPPIVENHSLHEELEETEGASLWTAERSSCEPLDSETDDVPTSNLLRPKSGVNSLLHQHRSPERPEPLHRVSSESIQITPKPPSRPHDSLSTKSLSPASLVSPSSLLPSPLRALVRFSEVVQVLRREPVHLARRVLAVSWTIGVTRVCRLPLWLAGIYFRNSPVQYRARVADVERSPTSSQENVQKSHSAHRHSQRRSLQRLGSSSGEREPLIRSRAHGTTSRRAEAAEATRGGSDTANVSRTPHGDRWPRDSPASSHGSGTDSTRRSRLLLWAKLSVALVMAIGVAVFEGPGAVLGEASSRPNSDGPQESEESKVAPPLAERDEAQMQVSPLLARQRVREVSTRAVKVIEPTDGSPGPSGQDFWGWEHPFVENLTAKDFENDNA